MGLRVLQFDVVGFRYYSKCDGIIFNELFFLLFQVVWMAFTVKSALCFSHQIFLWKNICKAMYGAVLRLTNWNNWVQTQYLFIKCMKTKQQSSSFLRVYVVHFFFLYLKLDLCILTNCPGSSEVVAADYIYAVACEFLSYKIIFGSAWRCFREPPLVWFFFWNYWAKACCNASFANIVSHAVRE
jgi:hypothetical protein